MRSVLNSLRPKMPRLDHRRANGALLVLLAVTVLAACEGEFVAPSQATFTGAALNEIAIAGPFDASSTDTLIHFSFAANGLVASTGDWDIAFRRFEVRLNGGISGTKGVLGYSMNNDESATDASVLTYTPTNTLSAFDAVRDSQIPVPSAFTADGLVESNTAYVNFTLPTGPGANPAEYWKVRTASGAYALMHVTAIAYTQAGSLTAVTVESRLQNGASLGAAQQVAVPLASAPVAISLAANAKVTPTGCNWDLQVNPQTFALTVNAACGAGTFPGASSPGFAGATTASDAPQYGAFLSGIAGPIPNDVENHDAPFRYNLQNDNRLYPSFNTYLIEIGATVYKLQLINYYDAGGTSGYPTIRYARIR